jgi:hypothetical protein
MPALLKTRSTWSLACCSSSSSRNRRTCASSETSQTWPVTATPGGAAAHAVAAATATESGCAQVPAAVQVLEHLPAYAGPQGGLQRCPQVRGGVRVTAGDQVEDHHLLQQVTQAPQVARVPGVVQPGGARPLGGGQVADLYQHGRQGVAAHPGRRAVLAG